MMKSKLLLTIIIGLNLLFFPKVNFGQAPNLGTAANFVLFSSNGAVTNAGTEYLTILTGKVGMDAGSVTGFGNVDGSIHAGGIISQQCTADLLAASSQIDAMPADYFIAPLLGNGQVLVAGVYSIPSPTTLDLTLTLDAEGDSNAVFVFQIGGTFMPSANAKVKLINGALACNVFWKVGGAITVASGAFIRGTMITNDAINMGTLDTLEGRALSMNGAVGVNALKGYLPTGCGSPTLTGPAAPALGSAECYGIFSSDGPVTDDGLSRVVGDVGTNGPGDLTTGYNPLFVNGTIHPIADGSTAQCASDVGVAYAYINALPDDIILIRPDLFGHNLVLTPHTYRMDGAVTFTDSLYLNAEGNPDAVFVIKAFGAFNTSVNSRVLLINGTQEKNVYWMINGAVDINTNSVFNGSFISAGAIDLQLGVKMNGRAFTTVGAINTYSIITTLPSGSAGDAGNISGPDSVCQGQTGVVYSVAAISGASGYTWTLPPGATITSGDNTDSITVSFSNSASNGNITVQGTGNCSNGAASANFPVTVSPTPTVDAESNQSLCHNNLTAPAQFSGAVAGTTYNWTNNTPSIGLPATGSGDILPFNASNTSTIIVIATITVTPTANGCDGNSTSFTITVRPTPTMNTVPDQAVCHNTATANVVFTGSISGTTYNWTNDNTTIGLSGSGSGDINSFTATNSGSLPQTATITVTPIINGCAGADSSFTITVSPAPTMNTVPNQALCHNAATANVVFTGSNVGTTYNWSNNNTSIGLSSNGSGNINSFTATNTGNLPVTATITVTPTINGCAGADSSFTITVNPSPTMNDAADQTLCNSQVSSPVAFSGAVAGTTYNWTNDNTSIGLSGNGSGDINSFTATNTGSGVQIATITVTPSNGNCNGSSTSFTITVNPTPTANAVANQTVCDKAATASVLFSGAVAGTTYNWTNDNTSIGLSANGTGDINSFTATNTGSNPQTATITVIPTNNGCDGSPETFTIVVNNCAVVDFHIPEGFSPNGDGTNDLFVIRGIDRFTNNTFTIFNRWGDKVYEADNYQNTWDGKSTMGLRIGGEELPTGTYFYILDLGDESKAFKGTIYLNR